MNAALRATEHRPWPMPARSWTMAQVWHDLLFAHWPIEAARMRELVPSELDLDLFDDRAWLGLVPFRMSGVRLRGTPALPWLSAFPELNLRTYVRCRGVRGVWFFALEAANPIAVEVARRWFHLPYFHARMRCEREPAEQATPSGVPARPRSADEDRSIVSYASSRTHRGAPPAELVARYGPSGPVELARDGSLEHWLTERYCLYTLDDRRRVLRGDIQHAPWPLQPARADFDRSTLPGAFGFEPRGAPHLHFARRLDVVVWSLRHA